MDNNNTEIVDHMQNSRGVIAESYADLQSLPLLEFARLSVSLPKASPASTLRALYQSVEIGLLNIANLLERATNNVAEHQFGEAMVKLAWVQGFHQILSQLSALPAQLDTSEAEETPRGQLKIVDSPAFHRYSDVLQKFDQAVLACMNMGVLEAEHLLASQSIDNPKLRLLHLIRLCNHETTIWERHLADIPLPIEIGTYSDFVCSQGIYQAVYEKVLNGDTFFMQFRGLHQIPEIITAEINDHLEYAILALRDSSPSAAYEHLRMANMLSVCVKIALLPMSEDLTTSDYHMIRENLGLTSGSHSVGIHYHLFKDLYSQVCSGYFGYVTKSHVYGENSADLQSILKRIAQIHLTNLAAFLMHQVGNELLQLRMFTLSWRDAHLHLPRNNVGGNLTKSLTGSTDAVQTVRRMRDAAQQKDPLEPLLLARNIHTESSASIDVPMATYFDDERSLDYHLIDVTGKITQGRFKQVQERTGKFANKSTFVPPPKRVV